MSRGFTPKDSNYQPKKNGRPLPLLEALPVTAPDFIPAGPVRTKWKHLVEMNLTSELSLQDSILFGNLCAILVDLERAQKEQKKFYTGFTEEVESKGSVTRKRTPYVELIRNLRDQIQSHCKTLGMTPGTRKYLTEANMVKVSNKPNNKHIPTPENEGDGDFSEIENIATPKH